MNLENIRDRLFPKKENPVLIEEIAKKFGLEKFEISKDKDGNTVIWLRDVDYATTKLAELVKSLQPKEIDCSMGRPDDAGSYAKITFLLQANTKITGSVFFANYLGDFSKVLTELGYKRTEWLEYLEQGKYTLDKTEK